MITDHKFRPRQSHQAGGRERCAWGGSCQAPRSEHVDSVTTEEERKCHHAEALATARPS
jgi:hypothetical protein